MHGGGLRCINGATATFRNNLAWANTGGDGTGDCPTWWQTNGNIVADPLFCNPAAGDYTLADSSVALTDPNGPMGAFSTPGCHEVPVKPTTWGRLKALYH